MTQQKLTSTFLAINAVIAIHIILAQLRLQFFLNDRILVIQLEQYEGEKKLKLAHWFITEDYWIKFSINNG